MSERLKFTKSQKLSQTWVTGDTSESGNLMTVQHRLW